MIGIFFITFAFCLLVGGIILLFIANKGNLDLGFSGSKSVYSDVKGNETLYSTKYGLKGRPDQIIKEGDSYIPIEIKKTKAPKTPYPNHIAQLLVYCALIEEHYKVRPEFGVIKYADDNFKIDYTPERELILARLILDMKSKKQQNTIHRNHNNPSVCRGCGFRNVCDEKLA